MGKARSFTRRAWGVLNALSVIDWLAHGVATAGAGLLARVLASVGWWQAAAIALVVGALSLLLQVTRRVRDQQADDERWIGNLRQLIGTLEHARLRFHTYKQLPPGYDTVWNEIRQPFSRRRGWGEAYHAAEYAMAAVASTNEDMGKPAGAHPADVDHADAAARDAIMELGALTIELEARATRGATITVDA